MLQVLVADDEATTRVALKALLERSGYDVICVDDGDAAWEVLNAPTPPQIAVLDWEMPGISGPEICRRLVNRSGAPFVYSILLTRHSAENDVIQGLDAGANDYMCKPFSAGQFRSRIGAAARIVQYEREHLEKNIKLSEYANELERLAEERARQLVHADRMATLGTMAAGIAHEINNPASFISGNLQTLELFWKEVSEAVPVPDRSEDDSKLSFIIGEMPKLIAEMRAGVTRISRIVQSLRRFSHAGTGKKLAIDINACVDDALLLCRNNLKQGVCTHTNLDADIPGVLGDATQLSQVLVNLITNAVHAMEPKGGDLYIQSARQNGCVKLTIRDTGTGIAKDNLDRIWLPFFTTKEVGEGTGLGLPICQKIIEEHGGEIEASNHESGGAQFTITLPIPKG